MSIYTARRGARKRVPAVTPIEPLTNYPARIVAARYGLPLAIAAFVCELAKLGRCYERQRHEVDRTHRRYTGCASNELSRTGGVGTRGIGSGGTRWTHHAATAGAKVERLCLPVAPRWRWNCDRNGKPWRAL